MEEVRAKEHEFERENIILFGGHPRWQKFFIRDNPDSKIKVINPQKARIDKNLANVIRNASVVYINTHHICHNQYETVMGIIRKNKERKDIEVRYVR